MLVQPAAAPDERHLRVRFTLRATAADELRFVDQRMFGGLSVSPGGADLPPEIAHIARDPVDPLFDDDAFVAAVRRRSSGVKRILLDQTVISGVGNIYADEALWRARLHGDRPGAKLRRSDVLRLLADVRGVMAAALDQGGTSFDALYVNVNGESGYFDRSLHAYGQEGRPCDRCGDADRAGGVHEPFVLLLPGLSAPAAGTTRLLNRLGHVPRSSRSGSTARRPPTRCRSRRRRTAAHRRGCSPVPASCTASRQPAISRGRARNHATGGRHGLTPATTWDS